MDVRLTAEQQQLRDAAAKLADDLGPGSVQDFADGDRIARLDKQIESDERRTKAQAPAAQRAARKPPAPARPKPRARRQRAPRSLRRKGSREKGEPSDLGRASHAVGLLYLFSTAACLSILGLVFAIVVKVVKG